MANFQNGGECFEGVCECPENYKGESCEEEVVPNKVFIESIELVSISQVDPDGNPWDEDWLPDVFLEINKSGIEDFETGVVLDLNGSHIFPVNMTFESPWTPMTISVWDLDNDETLNAWMQLIVVRPYQEGQGFPTEFTVTEGDFSTPFQLKF